MTKSSSWIISTISRIKSLDLLHKSVEVPSESHKILNCANVKTSHGYQVFSAALLKKMQEVVEAGFRNIDRSPKLRRADCWLNNRDLYIHITTETPQLHPSTGERLSPPFGGETMPGTFRAPFQHA